MCRILSRVQCILFCGNVFMLPKTAEFCHSESYNCAQWACLHENVCVCVCVKRVKQSKTKQKPQCVFLQFVISSGPSLVRVPHIRVLYAQHNVVVGAGARVLAQQPPALQQRRLAGHGHVGRAPRLAVVAGLTDAHGVGAVPHQLLWPAGGATNIVTGTFALAVR